MGKLNAQNPTKKGLILNYYWFFLLKYMFYIKLFCDTYIPEIIKEYFLFTVMEKTIAVEQ
jgi:hypothetical protein